MFRNFKPSEHIKSQTKGKSSEQRNVRTNVLEQFPSLEPHIEDLLPKKKVLITGSHGFIMGYVIPILLDHGHEVRAGSASDSRCRWCIFDLLDIVRLRVDESWMKITRVLLGSSSTICARNARSCGFAILR